MKHTILFIAGFFILTSLHIQAQPGGYTFNQQIGTSVLSPNATKIKMAPNQYLYLIVNIFVQKIDLTGVVVKQWGGTGTGNGKFKNIVDITADENSNIYLFDKDNRLIQKFDASGNFINQWAANTSAQAIYFANAGIYTLESDGIAKYAANGTFIKKTPISFLSVPGDFCVDAAENFYVSQTYEVSKYNSTGAHQKNFGYWTFSGPGDIDIDTDSYLYVKDNFSGKINKYTQTSTNFIATISTGQGITSYTFDASANIFAHNNTSIQKLSPAGVYISKFSHLDFIGNGHFYRPLCMAVDSESNIYVADYNNLIQKFSPNGVFIKQWGGTGSTESLFNFIGSINIDTNDRIFVTDVGNKLIKQFNTDGVFINKYNGYNPGSVGVFNSGLTEMEIDKNNHQYILHGGYILKYTYQGTFLRYWGSTGYNEGQFTNPVKELEISNTNLVYVLDNSYVSMFDTTGIFISRFYAPGLKTIESIESDQLFAVTNDGSIIKYDTSGAFINSWPMQKGTGSGTFLSITKLFKAKDGSLFIFDLINNAVQKFSVNVTTSLPNQIEQSQNQNLLVYPNPSNGSFNIEFSKPVVATKVINLLGEVEEFHSNDIKTSFKGLLLLESSDENGNTYRTKILVE